MTALELTKGIWFGAPAQIVADTREIAWAENHLVTNEAYKWVLGKFVEADNANSNGHVFPLEDLKVAQKTIAYSPLNMLHREHHVVGCFAATEIVYPTQGDAHPFVESLAAFWRYYFEDEYQAVEDAYKEGSLFLSMECVPKSLTCMEASCGKEFAYQGRNSSSYCAHLAEPRSVKRLNNPHFTGGAIIIPPTRPGWKNANVTELTNLIEANEAEAEAIYAAFETDFSHLSSVDWEAQMAQVLALAAHTAKADLDKAHPDTARMAACGFSMHDGQYAIVDVVDLRNAIQAVGLAEDVAAVKGHVSRRASALGAVNLLPVGWV